jgi:hypothetical protein
MLPELVLGVLILAIAGQGLLLWRMRSELRSLRAACEAVAQTDVPTSMLVTLLARVERRLAQAAVVPPVAAPSAPLAQPAIADLPSMPARASSYDMARRLAREGVGTRQLVEDCGLSVGEAQLLRSLQAARERMSEGHDA